VKPVKQAQRGDGGVCDGYGFQCRPVETVRCVDDDFRRRRGDEIESNGQGGMVVQSVGLVE
jgi:hypothetical protein